MPDVRLEKNDGDRLILCFVRGGVDDPSSTMELTRWDLARQARRYQAFRKRVEAEGCDWGASTPARMPTIIKLDEELAGATGEEPPRRKSKLINKEDWTAEMLRTSHIAFRCNDCGAEGCVHSMMYTAVLNCGTCGSADLTLHDPPPDTRLMTQSELEDC